MVLFIAAFSVVAFAIGSETVLQIQSNRALIHRVDLFSAALLLCEKGDLSSCTEKIQSYTDRLVAVGVIDESNRLVEVHPRVAGLHDIVAGAQRHVGRSMSVRDPRSGDVVGIVGVLCNLSGSNAALPPRMLLVLRTTPYQLAWFEAVAAVTLVVCIVAFLRLRTLNNWFDRQVARPLREIAGLKLDPNAALSQLPSLETGDWQETEQITRQIEVLLRSFADADARARRVEQETRRQILHRELGFDLKLRRARDEASTDPLTRMRNRAFLESELEPLFSRHKENNAPLSAVMMDLDNFKRYNDTFGHQDGDALLRFVGSLLRGGIRPNDFAVRYGGDEFLLLLPETDAREACSIADRIIKLFKQHAGQSGHECGVSMSAGVASIPPYDCDNGHQLVSRADVALYAAKSAGKNTVALDTSAVADPPSEPSTEDASAPLRSNPSPLRPNPSRPPTSLPADLLTSSAPDAL